MRAIMASLPWWARYPLVVVLGVDVGVAVVLALQLPHFSFGGLIGGPIGVLVVQGFRNRDFERLPRADRLRVVAARRSGVPTGEHHLDAIARRQLGQAARSYWSDRVLGPLVFLVALACPVIAVWRRDNAWWLLLMVPMVVLLPTQLQKTDPRPRLAALQNAS